MAWLWPSYPRRSGIPRGSQRSARRTRVGALRSRRYPWLSAVAWRWPWADALLRPGGGHGIRYGFSVAQRDERSQDAGLLLEPTGVPRSRSERPDSAARPSLESRVVTVRGTASRDGSRKGHAEPWSSGRSRPRPESRYGICTRARRCRPSGHRRDRRDAGGGTRAPGAPCTVFPVRPRSGIGLRPARTRLASPRPGSGASWGRSALRERLPRRLGPGEAPGFEPLELLGDGLLDDRGQVAVGHRRAHEGPQPLELVVELGGGGELDLVAGRGEGLDQRGPGPGRGGTQCCSGRTGSTPAAATPSGRSSGWVRANPSGRSRRSTEAPPSGRNPGKERPRPGQVGGSVTSCRSGGRAASASRPEHPDGARSPPRAPRSPASTGGRLAPGEPPGSPGSGAGPASRRPSGAAARRRAWSGGGDALARRGRRRSGGRPRPRRGGGPRCSTRTSRARLRGRRAGACRPRQCARRGRPRRDATDRADPTGDGADRHRRTT